MDKIEEIRRQALDRAKELLGTGKTIAQYIAAAKEIEAYIAVDINPEVKTASPSK